ncbi:MAG: heavy-metal-associated domain-containing protein [Clostridia bacterium]|nr:heavy-metal-associated domain-containing protein [Clostridia bacterium]
MKTIVKIQGMTCEHCAKAVQAELENVAGVMSVKVDLKKGTATVKTEGAFIDKAFSNAVERAGFTFVSAQTKRGIF